MKKPGFFTVSEVAKILSVHPNTLRNWERQKKLLPQRDEVTRYRYYSQEQIKEYLIRGSVPKIEIKWGYDNSIKARIEEVTSVKNSLDVLVSSEASTQKEIDDELFELWKERLSEGVRPRFIRNLDNSQMRERAESNARLGIKTKHRNVVGVTFSIRDKKVVRIEVPSDNPQERLNLFIRDPKVAKSFSILFEKLWGGN